jgi:hypothetical protein
MGDKFMAKLTTMRDSSQYHILSKLKTTDYKQVNKALARIEARYFRKVQLRMDLKKGV